jgi:O-acetyl-ADP-ribose deacetylase (regulator of RNase III)
LQRAANAMAVENPMVDAESAATRWGEVPPPNQRDGELEAVELLDDVAATPYLMNEELNFRISLWQGDVTSLKVDAIVNCNNEELNERSGVSGSIFAAAGPQLEEACTRLGGCAPGEAKATRGFRLPAKHVIHTVPPQWSDGRDAEEALERCYTASTTAALQLQCATVAFACIKGKDAPREQVAHVALRAVRKLLEQPSARGIQLILFAMRPQARAHAAPHAADGTCWLS